MVSQATCNVGGCTDAGGWLWLVWPSSSTHPVKSMLKVVFVLVDYTYKSLHSYMSQYFAFPLLCVLSLTCTHTLKLLDYYILAA